MFSYLLIELKIYMVQILSAIGGIFGFCITTIASPSLTTEILIKGVAALFFAALSAVLGWYIRDFMDERKKRKGQSNE